MFCLYDLILYVLVNNFSVTSGCVFLGWTSTKQGLMCLAQGHITVTPVRLDRQPIGLESSTLPRAEPLRFLIIHVIISLFCWIMLTWSRKTNVQKLKPLPCSTHDHWFRWTKFQRKVVNIFLPIIFSICFGCSKEPSHWDSFWVPTRYALVKK